MSTPNEPSSSSSLTLSHMDLPGEPGRGPRAIHVFHNILSAQECQEIIESHTDLIPANVTTETIRDRQMFENEELGARIWGRIQPFFLPLEQEKPQKRDGDGAQEDTFDSIEDAKEWFDEYRINWITERFSKPEIKFFATPVLVDNEKKQIVS